MKKIIFDSHQDIFWNEYYAKNKKSQTSFDDLSRAGIKLVLASVFNFGLEKEIGQYEDIKLQITKILNIITESNNLSLIKNKKDLEEILVNDKTGIILHIEGLDFINKNNLKLLAELRDQGVRSLGLTWNKQNKLVSPAGFQGGLTSLGKKVIDFCNDNRLLVDLAHANKESINDCLNYSKIPMMITHANCYELCKVERNIRDREIKKLKKKKGVMGIFFSKKFIADKNNININDIVKQFQRLYRLAPNSTMIGSDFGGITSGLVKDCKNIFALTKLIELLEKKLGKKAFEKIVYKNFLEFLLKIL